MKEIVKDAEAQIIETYHFVKNVAIEVKALGVEKTLDPEFEVFMKQI